MLDPSRPLATCIRSLAHPALILLAAGLTGYAISTGRPLESLLPLVFVGVLGTVVVFERLLPYDRSWHATRREAARDGVYFLLGLVAGGSAQMIAAAVALLLSTGSNGLPLWAGIPLALVLADLGTYVFHRFVHRGGWWWKEHGVHHAQVKVNALNANTTHVLDVIVNTIVAFTPLLMLGFSAEAIFAVHVSRVLQTFVSHANADLRLGWLGHVFMGAEHHRLHHSPAKEHEGNYATVFTLWDRVFGTFRWEPGVGPQVVGVREPDAFPDPLRVWPNLIHPFVRSPAGTQVAGPGTPSE